MRFKFPFGKSKVSQLIVNFDIYDDKSDYCLIFFKTLSEAMEAE
jgi:hypothetical protein